MDDKIKNMVKRYFEEGIKAFKNGIYEEALKISSGSIYGNADIQSG